MPTLEVEQRIKASTMNNAAFSLELIKVRLSRYRPVLLVAWLALLCLQITRPCCELIAWSTSHEHATDHRYNTGLRASLAATHDKIDAHHTHAADLDNATQEPAGTASHCDSLSAPMGDLLNYSYFNKILDEPKQCLVNRSDRLTLLAGVISISVSMQRHQVPRTYSSLYLVTQRLRI
jgi:hypothetical protein